MVVHIRPDRFQRRRMASLRIFVAEIRKKEKAKLKYGKSAIENIEEFPVENISINCEEKKIEDIKSMDYSYVLYPNIH